MPHEALVDLVNELETYKPDITKTTPAIVVVNKMDMLFGGNDGKKGKDTTEVIEDEIVAAITTAIASLGKDASLWEIVFASGKTGQNVDEVLEAASRAWKRMNSASRNNSGDDDKEDNNGSSDSVWSEPNRF